MVKSRIGIISKVILISGISILVLMGLITAAVLAHTYCGQIVGRPIAFCAEIQMIIHFTAILAFCLGFCWCMLFSFDTEYSGVIKCVLVLPVLYMCPFFMVFESITMTVDSLWGMVMFVGSFVSVGFGTSVMYLVLMRRLLSFLGIVARGSSHFSLLELEMTIRV